jgi:hypothetical protein
MLDASNNKANRKSKLSILTDLSGGIGLLALAAGYLCREKPYLNLIVVTSIVFMLVAFLFNTLEDIKNGVVITDYGSAASYRSKNQLVYWLLIVFKLCAVAAGSILIFKLYRH